MSDEFEDTWPPELALRIDAACRGFEARLAAGERFVYTVHGEGVAEYTGAKRTRGR